MSRAATQRDAEHWACCRVFRALLWELARLFQVVPFSGCWRGCAKLCRNLHNVRRAAHDGGTDQKLLPHSLGRALWQGLDICLCRNEVAGIVTLVSGDVGTLPVKLREESSKAAPFTTWWTSAWLEIKVLQWCPSFVGLRSCRDCTAAAMTPRLSAEHLSTKPATSS